MTERAILLTIREEHANRILCGRKPEEYCNRPPRISEPARTIMYVSRVKKIVGEFTMEPVSGDRTPVGYPLPVRNPIRYAQPIPWASVRQQIPWIRPPQQNFRYLNSANAEDAKLLRMLEPYRNQPVMVDRT